MTLALRASAIAIAIAAAFAPSARADVSAAARAFSDGQSAQLEGDYDRAAQLFELAYANAPAKEALRSAVRARQLAGQLARAATLAEILMVRYADDPTSSKLASDVIAEARPKFGRITVVCASRCSLAIGGRAMSLPAAETQVIYVAVGRQTLDATFDDARSASREIAAVAGADNEVHVAPAPAQARPATPAEAKPVSRRSESRGGLSPVVPAIGAGLTIALAGAGVWSGLDTNKAHDTYVKNPTHDAFTEGQSKQQRTNILFISAGAVGVATAAIALLWTRWDSGEAPPVAVTPSSGGAMVSYGASF